MRLALLGETGVGGLGYRTCIPKIVRAFSTATGAGATYAAVVAGHALRLQVNGIPGTVAIIFDGTENTQAAFLAKINAQRKGFQALNAAGQIRLQAFAIGSVAGGEVLVTSDADVLASLGLPGGLIWTNSTGAQLINANYGLSAVRYFGGTGRSLEVPQPPNQHAIVGIIGAGESARYAIFMVDRQLPPRSSSSDQMRVTPSPS